MSQIVKWQTKQKEQHWQPYRCKSVPKLSIYPSLYIHCSVKWALWIYSSLTQRPIMAPRVQRLKQATFSGHLFCLAFHTSRSKTPTIWFTVHLNYNHTDVCLLSNGFLRQDCEMKLNTSRGRITENNFIIPHLNSAQESLDDSILSIFAVLPLNGDE